MHCNNCNSEVDNNYCSTCGQASKLKRIDGHYLLHEIGHLLHFEHGFLYTIKELFLRPGDTVSKYLAENRSKLVKPIMFIIVTSLIYSLINGFFNIEKGYVEFIEEHQSATGHIFKWIQDHYGYANIIFGIFIAFWVKIFFKKYDYNLYEVVVLLCYLTGISMFIYTIFAIFMGLTKIDLMQVGGMLGIAYPVWGIGQFFDRKKLGSYLKSFAAYIIGMITAVGLLFAIGYFYDMVVKH